MQVRKHTHTHTQASLFHYLKMVQLLCLFEKLIHVSVHIFILATVDAAPPTSEGTSCQHQHGEESTSSGTADALPASHHKTQETSHGKFGLKFRVGQDI